MELLKMASNNTLENTLKQLKMHNQSHLLAFWKDFKPTQSQKLLSQLESINFSEIDDWITICTQKSAVDHVPKKLEPAPFYPAQPQNNQQRQKYQDAVNLGKKLISDGKVAAFVVAGGQATRLGLDGPKGNLHVSPLKNKTLFQIFAENIKAVSEKYNTACPWYIMTSPLNHQQTIEIFQSNNFYGLNKNNIFIFQQGTLPNFSFDGKILLAEKDQIACSPDGHGGSLKALCNSKAIEDMKKKGVLFVSYFQVDNPLINIFDPLFIGLHALDNAQMSSKTVIKTDPLEKVGNFCLVQGKITVIEYSDLPDELAKKKNPDGSLVFQLGSIAIHIINVDFIEQINAKGFSLPIHKTVKKIPHLSLNGNHIIPEKPNGIKLETFVFDALPLASKSIILQTSRQQEFSPVKNATGTNTVKTAQNMIIQRAASWLRDAGINVPEKQDGTVDCNIEIAPSFALEKDDIKQKIPLVPKIKPKDNIYLE